MCSILLINSRLQLIFAHKMHYVQYFINQFEITIDIFAHKNA